MHIKLIVGIPLWLLVVSLHIGSTPFGLTRKADWSSYDLAKTCNGFPKGPDSRNLSLDPNPYLAWRMSLEPGSLSREYVDGF